MVHAVAVVAEEAVCVSEDPLLTMATEEGCLGSDLSKEQGMFVLFPFLL